MTIIFGCFSIWKGDGYSFFVSLAFCERGDVGAVNILFVVYQSGVEVNINII